MNIQAIRLFLHVTQLGSLAAGAWLAMADRAAKRIRYAMTVILRAVAGSTPAEVRLEHDPVLDSAARQWHHPRA